MSTIVAKNLSKSFGAEDIFSEISITIPPKARIGIVGPNGSGKSTFIKILIGLELPDSGTVHRARGLTIGYLPQKIEIDFERSAFEECHDVFKDVNELQAHLKKIEAALVDEPQNDKLLNEYGHLLTEYEEKGGYTIDARIKHVLQGLGISDGEEYRPWYQLSGGQKTRAYLARLLLTNPDLLVLDEPTNHLDLFAVEFLESFLQTFDGSVLFVSHDRYFLDQIATTILELSWGLESYSGNYSAYVQQRSERIERRIKEFGAQQEYIEKEEEYIRRNIEGQNTRQAQGRRKRLERLKEENLLSKPITNDEIKLRLKTDKRSGDLVIRTKSVKIGYPDDRVVLIDMPDVTLVRGECAAIIGPNGAGKSTLIKTILGELKPLDGNVILGSNLKIGYFAQAHELLRSDYTVYEEIANAAPNFTPGEVRNYAARFLFTGDDVYKNVLNLSGGERGRLALSILSLQNANLLLLDEPMNHLDVAAQETLQSILKSYEGTILLISHDRYLVNGLATQLWVVEPDTKSLSVFKGTYSQYKESLRTEKTDKSEKKEPSRDDNSNQNPNDEGTAKPKRSNNEQLRLERRAAELEKEINRLEEEMHRISEQMRDPNLSFEAVSELGERYTELEEQHGQTFDAWAGLDL